MPRSIGLPLILAVAVLVPSFSDSKTTLATMYVKKLQVAIVEKLKDPDSAKFRNIRLVDGRDAKTPGEGIYCGEVNAKNEFGGYVGFMPFIAAIVGDGVFVIQLAVDAKEKSMVETLCDQTKNGEISQ
jgi:hypothetical protein